MTDDGWLRTGDRAAPGLFGTVRFQGRSKDVIKVGGYSVYAVEVEAALAEHPAVAEAAVVALPDARLGEVPAAAVRLAPGSKAARAARDPDELLAAAAADLAPYKRPRRLVDRGRAPPHRLRQGPEGPSAAPVPDPGRLTPAASRSAAGRG